jgi:hypothetical protein
MQGGMVCGDSNKASLELLLRANSRRHAAAPLHLVAARVPPCYPPLLNAPAITTCLQLASAQPQPSLSPASARTH